MALALAVLGWLKSVIFAGALGRISTRASANVRFAVYLPELRTRSSGRKCIAHCTGTFPAGNTFGRHRPDSERSRQSLECLARRAEVSRPGRFRSSLPGQGEPRLRRPARSPRLPGGEGSWIRDTYSVQLCSLAKASAPNRSGCILAPLAHKRGRDPLTLYRGMSAIRCPADAALSLLVAFSCTCLAWIEVPGSSVCSPNFSINMTAAVSRSL